MPRINRGLAEGNIYHVLNRGNAKQEVFHKKEDYEIFIDLIREAKELHPVKLFAYCLMPNHFHLLIMPIKTKELSNFMQWLMTSQVRKHHKHYDTSGHVWQGRFKDFIVSTDEYLLTVLRYIENNPVRSGIVKYAKDWTWSSHRERILSSKKKTLLEDLPIELPEDWAKFVDQAFEEQELDIIHKSVNRGTPYGSQEWQKKKCKELGLESTIRPIGRPRKPKNEDRKK